MSDLLFQMYLDLLQSGGNEEMRRQILHASFMAGMTPHPFFSRGRGLYRIGERRWQLWDNE